MFAASQNGHSTVVQNLIANKVSIDQADNQWELIDRDKYRVSFTLKELTKHERYCWIASNIYMINYNGYVMEYNKYKLRIILVGGYFDSGFHRDIYGIKDDFSFVKVGKRKKYNIYFL